MKATGKFKGTSEGAFQRTFQHIGAKDAWSLSGLIFFYYTVAVISFLTDSVYLQRFDPTWIIVSAAGFLPPTAIAVAYKFLYLDQAPDKSRPVLNLIVAAIVGASRNLSVGLFGFWANLDMSQLWLFRFVGGAALGVCIFVVWSTSQGATSEYKAAFRSLATLQKRLATTREEMPEIIQEINEKLQLRTKASVIPQLESISIAIGESRSADSAIQQLRSTLENEIRPSLSEIGKDAPAPFEERNISDLVNIPATLPNRFLVFPAISILGSTLLQSMGYGFWLTLLHGLQGLLNALIAMLVYGFTFFALKQFIPRKTEFAKSTATLIIVIAALFSSLTTVWYLQSLELSEVTLWVLVGITIFTGTMAPVILAHTRVRIAKQKDIEHQISSELMAIAKENALFSQRIWVFRRRWLLVLHGTVQSALTAAVARLQTAKEVDGFVVEMVKQDIRRAQHALNSEGTPKLDFESSFAELENLWRGICNVSLEISERAKRALVRNSDSSFCVNEIAKEAISNAVRHGSATRVIVKIDRIEDDMLEIEITNDGIAPKTNDEPGLGTNFLDEICLKWSLGGKSRKVTLKAQLPVRV